MALYRIRVAIDGPAGFEATVNETYIVDVADPSIMKIALDTYFYAIRSRGEKDDGSKEPSPRSINQYPNDAG